MRIILATLCLLISTLLHARCITPEGISMVEGDAFIFFSSEFAVPGVGCEPLERKCLPGGVLSGDASFKYATCSPDERCSPVFGTQDFGEGEFVVAYSSPVAPCEKETRVCERINDRLEMSGSFIYETCN